MGKIIENTKFLMVEEKINTTAEYMEFEQKHNRHLNML